MVRAIEGSSPGEEVPSVGCGETSANVSWTNGSIGRVVVPRGPAIESPLRVEVTVTEDGIAIGDFPMLDCTRHELLNCRANVWLKFDRVIMVVAV